MPAARRSHHHGGQPLAMADVSMDESTNLNVLQASSSSRVVSVLDQCHDG